MKYSNSRRSGFTIVEVMIILAVFAIIIAVSVPAFIRSREISNSRQCQEQLAVISAAVDKIALDNKLQAGDPVKFPDDLVASDKKGYLKNVPKCPAGGIYSVSSVNAPPACSIAHNKTAAYAPHVYSTAIPAVK